MKQTPLCNKIEIPQAEQSPHYLLQNYYLRSKEKKNFIAHI